MSNVDKLFTETIKKIKEEPKKEPEIKEIEYIGAKIAFKADNPKYPNPLYTVRIPRKLAKEVEIKKGDELVFHKEVIDGKFTLKAELRRGIKNVR